MSDLFRHEAVQHLTRRLNGQVVLATPLSFKLTTGLAVAVGERLAASALKEPS